jgi:hypothetical protein
MTDRAGSSTRRRFVAVCGGGALAVLAGCTGADERPRYQEGLANQTNGTNATGRSTEETIAAQGAAITEPNTNAVPLESLGIDTHEYVVKDGYKGPTVQGVVSNTGEDPVRLVEVRVRVYNATGRQLGQYMARTGDLVAGGSWRFEAVLLAAATDIASYDIVALGVPD